MAGEHRRQHSHSDEINSSTPKVLVKNASCKEIAELERYKAKIVASEPKAGLITLVERGTASQCANCSTTHENAEKVVPVVKIFSKPSNKLPTKVEPVTKSEPARKPVLPAPAPASHPIQASEPASKPVPEPVVTFCRDHYVCYVCNANRRMVAVGKLDKSVDNTTHILICVNCVCGVYTQPGRLAHDIPTKAYICGRYTFCDGYRNCVKDATLEQNYKVCNIHGTCVICRGRFGTTSDNRVVLLPSSIQHKYRLVCKEHLLEYKKKKATAWLGNTVAVLARWGHITRDEMPFLLTTRELETRFNTLGGGF